MKNLSSQQKNRKFLSNFNIAIVKLTFALFVSVFFTAAVAYAQAPHISYASPQVYTAGVAISSLSPTNSGGAVSIPAKVTIGNYNQESAIAIDTLGNIYVSDDYTDRIIKIPPDGGSNYTTLLYPVSSRGITVDAAGDLYYCKGTNAIYKLPAGGNTGLIVASGLKQPNGLTIDNAGNLYFSEQTGADVKKIPAGSTTPVVIATGFYQPAGLAVDAAGNVYVADSRNNAIKKILAGSGQVVTLTAGNSSFDANDVAVDTFGNVYFTNFNSNLTEIPVGGGSNVVVDSTFYDAFSLAIDAKGNIFVGNTASGNGQTQGGMLQELPAGGYKISPLLPYGLSLNTRTGVISGMPMGTSPATNYTITATNSSGSSTAVVNIKVVAGTNKSLSGITINHGTLSPAFNTSTTAYAVSVANGISTVSLTPITSNGIATVTINGTAVASGSASAAIPLSIGANPIQVKVDSATTESVYTITVTRASSNIANLTALKISKGTLSPTFNSATTSYTSSVAAGVTSMTVTPTDPMAGASITVNGTAVASGTASPAINLVAGQNTISIVVTASDGTTTKTYTLTVTCPAGANDNLSSLKVSRGALSPAFNTNTTSYTASVVNGVTSMTVTPTTSASNATVTVNGTAVTSGEASGPITLFVGDNTITTVVTAFGGSATKTYTITVTRESGGDDSFENGISVTKPTETPTLTNDDIIVHTAVSPNGDGINDFLTIDNINQYPDNKLTILNRSGQLIYQATGYDNSSKVFDGHSSKNGQMQLPGTYFYELDYTVKGIAKTKTGFIVLKY